MATTSQARKKIPPIKIEGAKLLYKNFSGQGRQYNAAGLRNFHVVIDDQLADALIADGWNVRWHEPRNEGDPRWASLKVSVRFDNYPPRIVLFSADQESRSDLDSESVSLLDDAELLSVDLIITPSYWQRADGSGIKAYLKTMFVTLSPNDLEAKYMKGKPRPTLPDNDD